MHGPVVQQVTNLGEGVACLQGGPRIDIGGRMPLVNGQGWSRRRRCRHASDECACRLNGVARVWSTPDER